MAGPGALGRAPCESSGNPPPACRGTVLEVPSRFGRCTTTSTPLADLEVGGLFRPRTRVPAGRFMLYSHDGFGLGHFRRNLILGWALTELNPRASVLLACSAEGLETFSLPAGIDVLRLPGLRKVDNGHYVGRRLHVESARLQALRASLLASAVEHFGPHVLLADKHPVGIDGELLPALRLQQALGGRAALGLRDVLDDPEDAAGEWRDGGLSRRVAQFYQRLLVYGTPELLNPLSNGLLPGQLAGLVRFCGYVVARGADGAADSGTAPADLPSRDGRPRVLATVGGGEDGLPLLESFIDASHGATWHGVVVAGPQMESQQWHRLQTLAARAEVDVFRAVPQVERWYPHVDAIVCMGGYNSLLEAVSSGTPTLCVPRTRPRREQLIRARAFAARGLLWLVEPESLTREHLTRAIHAALSADRAALGERARATLDLGGALRAAAHLLALARDARPGKGQSRQPGSGTDSDLGRAPMEVSGAAW